MKLKLLMAGALALALSACASGLQTQHQKIGAACADAAAAGEVIATAADHGLVSQADAAQAASLYHSTDRYCEPVAESLTPDDYASLLSTAASLIGTASKVKKP